MGTFLRHSVVFLNFSYRSRSHEHKQVILELVLVHENITDAEYNGWFAASSAGKPARLHRCVLEPCARNRLEKCPLEHLCGRN